MKTALITAITRSLRGTEVVIRQTYDWFLAHVAESCDRP
jgi:hypothetical protein